MSVNKEKYSEIIHQLQPEGVTLVAVSKMKSTADIQALYNEGQRDFGENYVQELLEKQALLPQDIRWHFIGHLQSNKVKFIAPFVHLIHGVDSEKLLKEINKQAQKHQRTIACLLQVHIAEEETKYGFNSEELVACMQQVQAGAFPNVMVTGLMGMASFTEDTDALRKEFTTLSTLFKEYPQFTTLSMGMSNDYALAIECGSNMVRIGSLLFGRRS